MRAPNLLVIAVFASLILGCPTEDTVCDAGATQDCVCAGGSDGAQVCLDDGSMWGECDCGSGDDDAGDDDAGDDDDDVSDDDAGDDDTACPGVMPEEPSDADDAHLLLGFGTPTTGGVSTVEVLVDGCDYGFEISAADGSGGLLGHFFVGTYEFTLQEQGGDVLLEAAEVELQAATSYLMLVYGELDDMQWDLQVDHEYTPPALGTDRVRLVNLDPTDAPIDLYGTTEAGEVLGPVFQDVQYGGTEMTEVDFGLADWVSPYSNGSESSVLLDPMWIACQQPGEPREGIHITHVISGPNSAFGRVVCPSGLWEH